MIVRLRWAVLLPLAGVLAACGDPTDPGPIEALPRDLSPAEQEVVRASASFAFDLLRQTPMVTADSPNVFLSPLSASMALGMALNGMDGETWAQTRDVLGFLGLDEPAVNEAYRDLIALLRGLDPKVEFGLGNSVWARLGYPFYDDFYDRVRTYFDARLEELDFDDPGAVDVINDWVADATRDRITELLDGIPSDAVMYLINAVYFNGEWVNGFDPESTLQRPFQRVDGTTVDVDMMSVEAGFRFVHADGADVVDLPYGGGAFTAVAVLPTSGSLNELARTLDAAIWADWMARLQEAEPRTARVLLPRLELEYSRRLNEDLQDLGMTDAFDPALADFTRLSPVDEPPGGPLMDPELYISRVLQKTFLKVDEEGTEAAAATAVEISETTSMPSTPSFVFDRPFLFAIRERFSGTILFIGAIGDPS
jgi:serine protease inhibitor